MELEVKILDINEKEIIDKIENLGGSLVRESKQYLYTYDLPTIYGRYIDILLQLNQSENEIKRETSLSKLRILFWEIDNLLNNRQKQIWKEITGASSFTELLTQKNLLEVLNREKVIKFMKEFHNNDKKWIRLRQTEGKTTMTVKHILAENGTCLQQMQETEIEVPSIKEGNEFLEALGFCYKSYQEKKRKTYELANHKIEIDTWPEIPTYMEIEGESEEDLSQILQMLGYSIKDTVSCTADEIYKMNGKSMFEKREIKF